MWTFLRMLMVAGRLLLAAASLLLQPGADPSGHWDGIVKAPDKEVKIEIDLAKNSKGDMAATFGNPGESLKGIPLSVVSIDGSSITLELKAGSGGGTFHGVVGADGKSMSGQFRTKEGGYAIPFTATRTGDARMPAATKSAPITKELEGTWNGAMEVDGKTMRIVLKMANQPDGSASGTVFSVDAGGLEVPIRITQKASSVSIDVPSVGASYVGVLNEAGTELVGTWTQGAGSLPLRLSREPTRK
jgi:hypothetical protein